MRIAQIADGLRTDYVQDIAAPWPQVLTTQQGGSTAKYLRGLGLIGEQQSGGAWQYPLPDALGSVRQLADAQGQVQLAQRYDPFGSLAQRSAVSGQRSSYGFAGEEQDPTTGQLFLRARTYNPSTGRFLQADRVLGTPTDPRTLHRYAYAFNNPVNRTDPSGLMPPSKIAFCANRLMSPPAPARSTGRLGRTGKPLAILTPANRARAGMGHEGVD